MNTYIFLGGAIVAEVIGTTFMKYSEGFTRLWPSVGTAISYCAAFYLLSQTLENRHCCKVSDEAAFCLIQRPYISKTL
ncbi:SMR family transporter, partial [Enterobacter hormaechei]|uniref:SMR family transporter n=1 Tax=Enterobacter hormaechei TaxID=158836 RepID=UPI001EDA10CA